MQALKVFLSHISSEAQLARALKEQLERAIPGATLFVSGVDVHLGQAWLKALDEAMTDAQAVLVLCSRQSTDRPWVNFESGGGWARELPVIPVCHGGIKKHELPYPLSIFQGLDLEDARSCEELSKRLAHILGLEIAKDFDFEGMVKALEAKPPQRNSMVGIVLTHGQAEWDEEHNSVFDLPKSLPKNLERKKLEEKWAFLPLHQVEELLSPNLHALSGIILGNPWRKRMEPEVVSAFETWVTAGGRLLLLGFELGDRHHDGNLSDLARRFGIHPTADIVGTCNHGPTKPYGVPIDFQVADGDPHLLTTALSTIRLTNVQTVGVEPGGTEWLRVGENVVYRPTRTSVQYRRGTLTEPKGKQYDRNVKTGWLPVAVEAPSGLCGDGAVLAIGTWDLLGRPKSDPHQDTLKLFKRLLDWLSGNPINPDEP